MTLGSNKGVPFAGYAHRRIRFAIFDGAQQVRGMSRKVRARVMREVEAMLEEAGEEFAKELPEELDAIVTSFDALYGKFTGSMIVERLAAEERTPEHQLTTELDRARVRRAIAALPDEERALLHAFYWDGRTLDEIAAELGGVSRSTASRLHTQALALLREALG